MRLAASGYVGRWAIEATLRRTYGPTGVSAEEIGFGAAGAGAPLGGFSFYNWHKDESLGVDGRKDGCAAAIAAVDDQAAYSMAITDESPRAMKTLLAAQPFYLREGDVSIPGTPVLAHPYAYGNRLLRLPALAPARI